MAELTASGQGLAAEAHRRIIGMILEGRLPAGARLQEAALGQELGMSRTPVREAIKRIESEGLAVQEGRFLKVRRLPRAEIEEIFFLRLQLEPEATRAAATALAPARIEEMAARTRAFIAGDASIGQWQLDDAFHAMMLDAQANRAVIGVVAGLRRRTCMFDRSQVPDRYLRGFEEHLDILDALGRGDGDTAARLMTDHLTHARDAVLGRLDALEDQKARRP
ncbi:GntR family transcriptional regulator [Poseidonocella sp. HB161398]|uniref:GntR family transcriptional regulator n=1 Tax=Poseidonocella sp. HB161398 TaxID=2320855 RepID=UPI0011080CB0|nr:GntR family transcriptional regulator [Poseidonocella sp. HB161398]